MPITSPNSFFDLLHNEEKIDLQHLLVEKHLRKLTLALTMFLLKFVLQRGMRYVAEYKPHHAKQSSPLGAEPMLFSPRARTPPTDHPNDDAVVINCAYKKLNEHSRSQRAVDTVNIKRSKLVREVKFAILTRTSIVRTRGPIQLPRPPYRVPLEVEILTFRYYLVE